MWLNYLLLREGSFQALPRCLWILMTRWGQCWPCWSSSSTPGDSPSWSSSPGSHSYWSWTSSRVFTTLSLDLTTLYLYCHYIYISITPYLYEYPAWYPCHSQLSVQTSGRWREHCVVTQVAAPLLGGPHTASGPAVQCTLYRLCCIYYLPPLQWISKTWKGHGHTEHWSSQTCLWEPTHQLQILWLDKRWCCRRKILVYQCFFKLHLFRVN